MKPVRLDFRRRRRELPDFASARTSAFTQLLEARRRQLASSGHSAAAGDTETALSAFLDADAISGELGVMSSDRHA